MDILQLKIKAKEKTATNSFIIYLEEINQQPIYYEAGQFLTFLFYHNGSELRRSYSIVTTPGIDKELAVAVKRQVNGEISRWLTDNLKPGDVLTSLYPAGRFTLDTNALNQRIIFFIAAGSGIGPVFSLLKKVLHGEPLSKIILIYQNRNEASMMFKKELEMFQSFYSKRFILLSLLSNPANKQYPSQRLNNALLEQLILSLYDSHTSNLFYICGPGSLMRMTQFVLKFMGFPEETIRREYFVIDPLPAPPVMNDSSPKQITLRWKDRVYHFNASYPVNILQAALNNDIYLPYSCLGGKCSTCTVKCISGKVKMSINEVLTDKDLQQGLVLTCVGFAETDLVLEL